MARPQPGDYAPYTISYIDQVKEETITDALDKHSPEIIAFFRKLPVDKASFRYAPGKWSLKQVLQHIIDTERIFTFRALTFARRDDISLPGFDENIYADNSNGDDREWSDLLAEFTALRTSTDYLFKSFNSETLKQDGTANNQRVTVNALCYISLGHVLHHMNVISERYMAT